jgi:cohesin complex subunit SA-1/2
VAFDHCSKIIVDVLREEGMYKGHGDIVVDVVTSALKDVSVKLALLSSSSTDPLKSFTLLLEGVAPDEMHSVSLAKCLVPCLMMRGAQLSVVRKLDSQHVVAIHTQLLGWAARRLEAYESNKNKNKKDITILFFKILQPLLAPLENRDALTMYASS